MVSINLPGRSIVLLIKRLHQITVFPQIPYEKKKYMQDVFFFFFLQLDLIRNVAFS